MSCVTTDRPWPMFMVMPPPYFQGLHAALKATLAAGLRPLSLLFELVCFLLPPV